MRTDKRVRLEDIMLRRSSPRALQSRNEFWANMQAHVLAAGGKVIPHG